MQMKTKIIGIGCLIIAMNVSLFAQDENGFIRFEHDGERLVPSSLLATVSFDLDEVPFEEALSAIAEKADLRLSYNRDRIPVNEKVSLKMNNVSALEALIKIMRDTGTALTVTREGQLAIIPSEKTKGKIEGRVINKVSGKPLIGVNVVVLGTDRGAATDGDGRFTINDLPFGNYVLIASMIGYSKRRVERISVTGSGNSYVRIELEEKAILLSEVIVTPGHFSLMEKEPESRKALKAEDIRSFPQLGEDIYRAARWLPGIGGNDFAAGFTVRGGEHDEVLVLLDGMELYEPFHLKDLEGLLSIIDVESIRGIDMMTGAFPTEYGDRLSGVFNMRTITPVLSQDRRSVAISFLNFRAMTEKNFADGKGQALFVFRRGYLDLLLQEVKKLEGDDYNGPPDNFSPVYYDFLGKIQYNLNPNNILSGHFLWARDDLELSDEADSTEAFGKYGNLYGWLRWHTKIGMGILGETIVSVADIREKREITEMRDLGQGAPSWDASDKLDFSVYTVKQNWSMDLSDKWIVKMGGNIEWLKSEYDYLSSKYRRVIWEENGSIQRDRVFDTTSVSGSPEGNQQALYLANRVRLLDPFVVEAGLRYDRASWTGDNDFSPRLNLSYELSKNTTLRAGWGKFHQIQGINKLNYADGDENFYSSDLEEHRVLGIDKLTDGGLNLRVEAYQKVKERIRPHYVNFHSNYLEFLSADQWDRTRLEPESGESKGIEIYVSKNNGAKFRWWTSYAYSKVSETINKRTYTNFYGDQASWESEIIDGGTYPKVNDQRHTFYINLAYLTNSNWRYNVGWQYHSGWPYSSLELTNLTWVENGDNSGWDCNWQPGEFLAERFPPYHRMDVRISREFMTSRGRISTFMEVQNLYNRRHPRYYEYMIQGELPDNYRVVEVNTGDQWMSVLPSFGVSWDF